MRAGLLGAAIFFVYEIDRLIGERATTLFFSGGCVVIFSKDCVSDLDAARETGLPAFSTTAGGCESSGFAVSDSAGCAAVAEFDTGCSGSGFSPCRAGGLTAASGRSSGACASAFGAMSCAGIGPAIGSGSCAGFVPVFWGGSCAGIVPAFGAGSGAADGFTGAGLTDRSGSRWSVGDGGDETGSTGGTAGFWPESGEPVLVLSSPVFPDGFVSTGFCGGGVGRL
jgi:hypothetical protein